MKGTRMAAQPIHAVDNDIMPGKRHPGRRMTEAQFEAWVNVDTRAEWVDGEVVMMSPANYDHSDISLFLASVLRMFVESKGLGSVQCIEVQVRLGTLKRRRVPDVLFVSKRRMHLVKPTYVDGAPDLIMEVVSPDSDARDWRDKYLDYQAAGVGEYWVIDPMSKCVEAYALTGKSYQRIMERRAKLASGIVKGFWIKPAWLWESPRPSIASVLRELKVIS